MELRPFHIEDLAAVGNRDGDQATAQMAQMQATQGIGFTAWEGDTPIGCAGVVLGWPGVGFAWMALNDRMNGHAKFLVKMVRRVLEDATEAFNLHRIEAVCLTDSPRNRRFLEMLGFIVEQGGMAQAFMSDRRNVLRYERVRKD